MTGRLVWSVAVLLGLMALAMHPTGSQVKVLSPSAKSLPEASQLRVRVLVSLPLVVWLVSVTASTLLWLAFRVKLRVRLFRPPAPPKLL